MHLSAPPGSLLLFVSLLQVCIFPFLPRECMILSRSCRGAQHSATMDVRRPLERRGTIANTNVDRRMSTSRISMTGNRRLSTVVTERRRPYASLVCESGCACRRFHGAFFVCDRDHMKCLCMGQPVSDVISSISS